MGKVFCPAKEIAMKINRSVCVKAAALSLGLAALGAAGMAQAANVAWSVGVSVPGVVVGVGNAPVYARPAPVYVSPAPVYYGQPAPVYVQPAPVYVQPAPVYVRPAPVYPVGWVQPYYPGWRGHGHGYYGPRPGWHR